MKQGDVFGGRLEKQSRKEERKKREERSFFIHLDYAISFFRLHGKKKREKRGRRRKQKRRTMTEIPRREESFRQLLPGEEVVVGKIGRKNERKKEIDEEDKEVVLRRKERRFPMILVDFLIA